MSPASGSRKSSTARPSARRHRPRPLGAPVRPRNASGAARGPWAPRFDRGTPAAPQPCGRCAAGAASVPRTPQGLERERAAVPVRRAMSGRRPRLGRGKVDNRMRAAESGEVDKARPVVEWQAVTSTSPPPRGGGGGSIMKAIVVAIVGMVVFGCSGGEQSSPVSPTTRGIVSPPPAPPPPPRVQIAVEGLGWERFDLYGADGIGFLSGVVRNTGSVNADSISASVIFTSGSTTFATMPLWDGAGGLSAGRSHAWRVRTPIGRWSHVRFRVEASGDVDCRCGPFRIR